MQTYTCQCGGRLFFQSTRCVACEHDVARCPHCRTISAVEHDNDNENDSDHRVRCLTCRAAIRHCANRVEYGVCNGAVPADEEDPRCAYCSLNRTVPDLTVHGNLQKWQRLEQAKHRVLFDCQRLGLPLGDHDDPVGKPLRFDFKSSTVEPVATGHAEGVVTIELSEADSVQRERTRVQFGEPQRTLVGHIRHELGHYYWERIVAPRHLNAFRNCFGDERNPSYAEAKKRYYAEGPPANWQDRFISAYAAMHPWEDFAESFNSFLDMVAIVSTSNHFQRLKVAAGEADFDRLFRAYVDVGIVVNELNRDMGLLDLVPEVFTPPVVEKLRFVHDVVV
jgi:hypothetical protein